MLQEPTPSFPRKESEIVVNIADEVEIAEEASEMVDTVDAVNEVQVTLYELYEDKSI